MNDLTISYFKIFEYLFFFSPKRIKKRSKLYELRELFNFFIKIFQMNFFKNYTFLILLKKFTKFFFEILNSSYFKSKNLNHLNKCRTLSRISTQYFNYFFSMITKSSSLGYRLSFFKNFTIISKKWILGEHTIGLTPFDIIKSSIKHFKNFQNSYLTGISFLFWSYRKFNNHPSQIELVEKSIQNKNLGEIFSDINFVFFSFDEFINFFFMEYVELQIPWICKKFILYDSNLITLSRSNIYRLFKAEKFLVKIKKYKTFKSCLRGLNFCLFVEKNFSSKVFFFKSFKYRFLYLPKFKIHNLFLEIFQKNINIFFELDQLKENLVLITPSKFFIVATHTSKKINSYTLFLFKILNYIYILKFKILNNLFSIETTWKNGYNQDKYSYTNVKIGVFGLQKQINDFRYLNLTIKNLHFSFIMVNQLLVTLTKKIKEKIVSQRKDFRKYLFKIKSIESNKQENIFLERLNYWQKIFENRLNCFIYCLIELKYPKVKTKFFEFNEFSFRQIGL